MSQRAVLALSLRSLRAKQIFPIKLVIPRMQCT